MRALILLLPLIIGAADAAVPDGRPHRFEARDHQFWLDGQPMEIAAGEMHFGRVQPSDWELRIEQAKAMGLNTVSFYLFWNQVEPVEGRFDFSGMTDVRRVLKLCRAHGMWAILRPGPYCCAEIEYGGIPAWTLKHPEVPVRTADPRYLDWSRRYVDRVAHEVADLQVTRGGPLLMVQVENEYGIVADGNVDYLKALVPIFRSAGFEVPLFTCEPTTPIWKDPALRVPGLIYGRNGLKDDRGRAQSAAGIGDNPVYVPEVYTAWFSGWGEPIAHRYPIPADVKWLGYLLDHRDSFCLYLEFGGTNYGFTNGCNWRLPVQTSYDYDAPIDEAGRITERYRVLRDLLRRRLGVNPPPPPPDPVVGVLPPIELTQSEPMLGLLPKHPTRVSERPVAMEDLDQATGFVLYRKTFPQGLHGKLSLREAQDYTTVMVNGRTVDRAFAGYGPDGSSVELDQNGPCTLDLLVYNLGRISVPVSAKTQHLARKGLIGGADLAGQELLGWQIYSLPFNHVDHFKAAKSPGEGPAVYRGHFNAARRSSTFLDMRGWHLGVVWVNGNNLGRYWDHGGLRSLFVPRQWVKAGRNEIDVLELEGAPERAVVATSSNIVETAAVAFAVKLDQRP